MLLEKAETEPVNSAELILVIRSRAFGPSRSAALLPILFFSSEAERSVKVNATIDSGAAPSASRSTTR